MQKGTAVEEDIDEALIALGESQHGLFTLEQSKAVGLTEQMRRSRLGRKTLKAVYRDVFSFTGHPLSQEAVHLAAVMAGGPTARSSHRASAWFWSMTPHPQKPEITTTDKPVRLKGVRCHWTGTAVLGVADRRGVPVSSAAETLLDLGAVVPLRTVSRALDRGVANKVLTPMSALAELDRRGGVGVRGTAHLRKLLDDAGISGSHHPSVLERKMRVLIRRAGLPQPECELVVGKNGEYRLDFCWAELMLAIEVDGWMYHSSTAAFHGNKTRKNSLVVDGYAILEYTWIHVTKTPADVVREIKNAYEARRRSTFGNSSLLSNGEFPKVPQGEGRRG